MAKKTAARGSFIERTIRALSDALDRAAFAERVSQKSGMLQALDPRVKIVGILLLVLAAVASRRMAVILGIFALAIALAVFSRISPRVLATRVWTGVLAFTGVIALPAIFLTPGCAIYEVPMVRWPVTAQGMDAAARLLMRAETTATLALVLVLSTPWTHVLKALRSLRVPATAVVILGMTHRYIFLLLHLARDFFEARRSRLVGPLAPRQRRQLAAGVSGILLGKSMQISGEVFLAMQSRGFQGEIYTLDDFQMGNRDWVALGGVIALAALAFWLGSR